MHCCVIKAYKISASQLINAIRKYMVCLCAPLYECVFSVYLWLIHPSPPKWNSSRSAQINKKAATSTLSMIAVENDKIAPAEEEPHPGLIEQMKVERDRSTRWCRPNPDSPLICHDKSSVLHCINPFTSICGGHIMPDCKDIIKLVGTKVESLDMWMGKVVNTRFHVCQRHVINANQNVSFK